MVVVMTTYSDHARWSGRFSHVVAYYCNIAVVVEETTLQTYRGLERMTSH